jgi:hypothetical protein
MFVVLVATATNTKLLLSCESRDRNPMIGLHRNSLTREGGCTVQFAGLQECQTNDAVSRSKVHSRTGHEGGVDV